MTIATLINAVVIVLCLAVLVQGWRMDRRMRAFRESQLGESVAQLDRATGQAKLVLGQLKSLLATDGLAHATAITSAENLRDELSVMVGIGNSVAERIVEAVSQANGRDSAEARAVIEAAAQVEAETQAEAEAAPKKPARKSPRRRTAARKTTAKARTTKAPSARTKAVSAGTAKVAAAPAAEKKAAAKSAARADNDQPVESEAA